MPRVLILGLDGATWTVLDPLIRAGVMPNLAALVQRGCHGVLQSTEPPVTPVAWTSIQTGVLPERHGVYGFYNLVEGPEGMEFVPTTSATIRVKTLWEYAGEQGARVAVLACPMTYPPFPVNGILLPGFPAPSSRAVATYPEDLKEEIARLETAWVVPASRTEILPRVSFGSAGELAAALQKVADAVGGRVRLAEHLLRTHPWDLAFFQFQEVDWIQHAFWPDLERWDPDHPRGRALASFYRAVDAGIGDLAALLDAGGCVLVISDHGFQACRREVYPNRWLARRGLLRQRRSLGQSVLTALSRARRALDPQRKLVNRIPRERRARLATRFHRARLDWRQSRAYALSDGSSPTVGLYALNGRDPAEAAASLQNLVDPETAEPAVAECLPLQAERQKGGPALWIRFRPGYAAMSAHEPGPLFRPRVPGRDYQLGIHHRDGILVAAGPGVRVRGKVASHPQVVDVAPTALYMLGLPVPGSMDGDVVVEAFDGGYLERRPPRRVEDPGGGGTRPSGALSAEEEAQISRRLRELGYLD